jgi:hypothetical protein
MALNGMVVYSKFARCASFQNILSVTNFVRIVTLVFTAHVDAVRLVVLEWEVVALLLEDLSAVVADLQEEVAVPEISIKITRALIRRIVMVVRALATVVVAVMEVALRLSTYPLVNKSWFGMSVLLLFSLDWTVVDYDFYSFLGPLRMKISWNCSKLPDTLSKPKYSTMERDLKVQELYNSLTLKRRRQPSVRNDFLSWVRLTKFVQPNSVNICMEDARSVRNLFPIRGLNVADICRLIDVQFNDRWHHFSTTAAKGSLLQ